MEYWLLIILVVVVVVMAEVLRWMQKSPGRAGRPASNSHRGKRSARDGYRPAGSNGYHLAPKDPDVLAGALFNLMKEVLNHSQMLSLADLIVSPQLTARYVRRLASSPATADIAENLARLTGSMEANRFSEGQRTRVSTAMRRMADREYKLLEIHRNMDKIM